MNNEHNHIKECKCKLLPLSLSSNTAAEFGDLTALRHRLSSSSNSSRNQTSKQIQHEYLDNLNNNIIGITTNTTTPLHLAAQNGHAAITSYLLLNQYDADLGLILPLQNNNSTTITDTNNTNPQTYHNPKQKYIQKHKLATPLHRACYSGSLTCIKLLIDFGANVMIIDYSMDDGMTPLHKAIKGGRYLVVMFLLQHFKNLNDDGNNNNNHNNSILKEALETRDKRNRKPIDLALELQSMGEDAILSVRRWDVVAGGEANWNFCVTLLQNAEKECNSNNVFVSSSHSITQHDNNNEIIISSKLVFNDIVSKCNCENNQDDQCKTSIWEAQFHSAMLQSTQALMKESNLKNDTTHENNNMLKNSHKAIRHNDNTQQDSEQYQSIVKDESNTRTGSTTSNRKSTSISLGLACQQCGLKTISLFRFEHSYLVCRKCLKNLKYRY